MEHLDHGYTFMELAAAIIGTLLALAFGAWGAVVKHSADQMYGNQIERVINELASLREEIHRDRLQYEHRFTRIERSVGFTEVD